MTGKNQPDDQSVGTFYAKGKLVYFYIGGLQIQSWKRSGFKAGKVISLSGCPGNSDDMNGTLMFTGCTGYEFTMVDYAKARLYFFNLKGKYTGTVDLPSGTEVNERFNCGFANNHFFLFDTEERIWTAYSVCN